MPQEETSAQGETAQANCDRAADGLDRELRSWAEFHAARASR